MANGDFPVKYDSTQCPSRLVIRIVGAADSGVIAGWLSFDYLPASAGVLRTCMLEIGHGLLL